VHRVARLAALVLAIRLVLDLATPLLPGAFVLHSDGLYGLSAAHGNPVMPGVDRANASRDERHRAVTVAPPPRRTIAPPAPWRHASHPLRQPGDRPAVSADRSSDH
jgi:hypothetical protein